MTNAPMDSRWAIKRAAARATMDPTRPGRRLTPPQKGVLMQLADMADDGGCCWPGVARLSERTAFSERCVRNALRSLEAMGLVRTTRGGGRGCSSEYVLQMGVILLAAASQEPRQNPAPAAGFDGTQKPGTNPAPQDAKPGTGCPRITKNIQSNTPPTPSRGLSPSPKSEQQGPSGGGVAEGELLTLRDWLARCQRRGEQAIAPDDPVWSYAEGVGLPPDFVALAWQQFKRRRLGAGKRQRDWRRAFRDSVESCAYRLWRFTAEGGAVLSTEGLQAQRFFAMAASAEQAAA